MTRKDYDEMVRRAFQGTVDHPLLIGMLTQRAAKTRGRLMRHFMELDRAHENGHLSRRSWKRLQWEVVRQLEELDWPEFARAVRRWVEERTT
jgi:hypothetical protein